jgi:micrococcal nuclease
LQRDNQIRPSARIILSAFWGLLGADLGCATHECPQCPPCPACPACPEIQPAPVEPDYQNAKWFVIHVTDGDTLVARLGKPERRETVRMLNINTPEKNRPGFGEAREALKVLVRGGYVTLESEKPGLEKRDRFGRLLAYVVADGVNCNIEMVRLGWSAFYKKYGKGRLADEFEAAEKEAKERKLGIWGI